MKETYLLEFQWFGGTVGDVVLRTGMLRGTSDFQDVLYRVMRVLYGLGCLPVAFDSYGHVRDMVLTEGCEHDGVFDRMERGGLEYFKSDLGLYYFLFD